MPKSPSRLSDAHREAIRQAAIRRYADPAERRKTGEAAQGYWANNDAAKAQQAATTRANWQRPGYRARVVEKMRGRKVSEPRIDEVNGSVYIAANNSLEGWRAYKVGSVMAGREERRCWELGQGYRDWAKPGDEVVFLETFACHYFRRVEARAHELLGLDEHHIRFYGEITTESFPVIRRAITRAILEIDGERA